MRPDTQQPAILGSHILLESAEVLLENAQTSGLACKRYLSVQILKFFAEI
jgi:hypothetical protein